MTVKSGDLTSMTNIFTLPVMITKSSNGIQPLENAFRPLSFQQQRKKQRETKPVLLVDIHVPNPQELLPFLQVVIWLSVQMMVQFILKALVIWTQSNSHLKTLLNGSKLPNTVLMEVFQLSVLMIQTFTCMMPMRTMLWSQNAKNITLLLLALISAWTVL